MGETILDTLIHEDLARRTDEALRKGELLTRERATAAFDEFRAQFGPERLASLDGEALLLTMHGRGRGEECLAYWLEFKNDEVFPGRRFGSIAGGSAFKFGIYRRDADGAWVTGTGVSPRIVEKSEAIGIARRQRDQFLRGHEILAGLSVTGDSDEAYQHLQKLLEQVAPDLVGSGWAHKYWYLLFPDRLDDYHEPTLQRYHLIRLLQAPPDGTGLKPQDAGRYACAGRFVSVARALGIETYQLGSLLKQRHGQKRGYWRVGTASSEDSGAIDHWPQLLAESRVAVGYPAVGDLSSLLIEPNAVELKRMFREEVVRTTYPNDKTADATAKAACTFGAIALLRLTRTMQIGDIVLACRGGTVHGIGRIVGDYVYADAKDFRHSRPVEWFDNREWRLPGGRVFRDQVITDLAGYPDILVETERRLSKPSLQPGVSTRMVVVAEHLPPLNGALARIEAALQRKGQVIIYGPPGTGKTHWALKAGRELACRKAYAKPLAGLSEAQEAAIGPDGSGHALVRFCSFHPGYGYEDFIEGYRPVAREGQLTFELRDGLFKQFCARAAAVPTRDFFLVIDEINRADIPRVFGELLTSIERDKRAVPVHLPLSGTPLQVPDNLYLIGTMNTADRSISLLDAALRRRFAFIELMPDYSTLSGAMVGGLPLAAWLEALNRRLIQVLPRDSRNLQVGHAYLLEGGRPVDGTARFGALLRDHLIPLLEEYCYEDFGALAAILSDGIVDVPRQRIRDELFASDREAELIEVVETMFDELGVVASAADAEKIASGITDLLDDEPNASTD